ncbi:hypothetical protein ERO13_A04G077000v2 [Gossypium hirsutum]|nr:hypothetical protein ERO13_A04G077000v2 [Gossypium hirsutum]
MDIRAGIGSLKSQSFWKTFQRSISSCNFPCSSFKTFCSKKDSQQQPQQNGDDNNGDKFSTDWDKAWSNLMLWTSPGFTLVGAIIIVSFLLLYTILAPVK